MKKIIAITTIAILFFSSAYVYSQADWGQNGTLLSLIYGENIKTAVQTADIVKDTREALKNAKDMKNDVQNLYNLYNEIDRAAKSLDNIKEMNLADWGYLTGYMLDLDLDPVNYIPYAPQTADFVRKVREGYGNPTSARTIVSVLNYPFNISTISKYSKRWSGANKREEAAATLTRQQAAELREAEAANLITLYFRLAKVYKEQADALAKKLSVSGDEGGFKMNDSERINMSLKVWELYAKSQEYRYKATELMNSPSPAVQEDIERVARGQQVNSSIRGMRAFQHEFIEN